MATYDLTSSIPSASSLKTGDILNCPYSGAIKSVELPAGQYKLLVWGASGGIGSYSSNGTAGKGGYSEGNITFSDNTIVYIVVGGQGGVGTTSASGGYNGGGAVSYSADGSSSSTDCGGGGGATHIATRTGLLSSLSSYKSSIYIVAGGGGGIGWNWSPLGGAGGGTSGGDGYCSGYAQYIAYGGTLNAGGATSSTSAGSSGGSSTAGSFGLGGNGVGFSDGGAGGGGGYYGGGGAVIAAGGGGSGYVSSVLTSALTIAGNTSFPSTSNSTETGHSGNGYAKITVIKVNTDTAFYVKVSQNIALISKALVKVSDNWKEVKDIYTKVNGNWIKT